MKSIGPIPDIINLTDRLQREQAARSFKATAKRATAYPIRTEPNATALGGELYLILDVFESKLRPQPSCLFIPETDLSSPGISELEALANLENACDPQSVWATRLEDGATLRDVSEQFAIFLFAQHLESYGHDWRLDLPRFCALHLTDNFMETWAREDL